MRRTSPRCVFAAEWSARSCPTGSRRWCVGFERYGILGGAIATSAIRHGADVALIDERGELSYKQLHERSNGLANAWREHGLEAGEGVAIVARNHRGFSSRSSLQPSAGQRSSCSTRRLPDRRFAKWQVEREPTCWSTTTSTPACSGASIRPAAGGARGSTIEAAPRGHDRVPDPGPQPETPPKPSAGPRITILTSGTTGTPKGAARGEPRSLGLLGGLLSKVPFRAREVTGAVRADVPRAGLHAGDRRVGLGSTLVVRRRFEPEVTVESLEHHRATAMVVVPVMLRRILDLGEDAIASASCRRLRIIFVSGSALGTDLARRAMEAFGPVIYNLYGSTEVAYATIATPEDLEADTGHRRASRAGLGRQDSRRARQGAPAGGDAAGSSSATAPVRGLHRRRQQARGRRADVLGRRRPLRRGGAACSSTAATTR